MRTVAIVVLAAACTDPAMVRSGDPDANAGDGGDHEATSGEPYLGPTHPESGRVVWASNRHGGTHDVYSMQPDGSDVQRLTFTGGRGPLFSPDGRWIAYWTDPGTVHVMRPDAGEDTSVCENVPPRDGPIYFWMHDGSGLVCPETQSPLRIANLEFYRVDPETGATEHLFDQHDFPHLVDKRFDPGSITRDARYLVGWAHNLYTGGYTGDNGTFDAFHATVLLELTDPTRLYMLGAGCLSATSPVDDTVFNVSRESPTSPDLFRMSLADLATRASYRIELGYEDLDWGHEYMPSISNDGQWLIYAASVACHAWYDCDYEVFVHRLGAGAAQRERLTFDEGNDNFPSLWVDP